MEAAMYRIGIDLGGTTVKIGLLDEAGNLIKMSIPTESSRGYQQVFRSISECVFGMLKEQGITMDQVEHVGLDTPGILSEDGMSILFASNLNFVNVEAVAELKKYFHCPVTMKNDADSAALGEHVYGAGKGCDHTVTITIGTGIGAGIVIDNRIMAGSFRSGGEIGHHILVVDGEPCPCGQRGCMERYCSATALIEDAKARAAQYPDSEFAKLCQSGQVDAKAVFQAAEAGDWAAIAAIDRFIRYLGVGIINVINILQPQAVIIGGGVSGAGDMLIRPLKAYIKNHLLFGEQNFRTDIRCAKLGNDAGMIGAALM